MAMRFGGKFMLSKEDVIKVAKLSKLEFTEQEIENYRNDLKQNNTSYGRTKSNRYNRSRAIV
jgi:hypothetical protein